MNKFYLAFLGAILLALSSFSAAQEYDFENPPKIDAQAQAELPGMKISNGMSLSLPAWVIWPLSLAFIGGMALIVSHILNANSVRDDKAAQKRAARELKASKKAKKIE
jgi:hypothetical protein